MGRHRILNWLRGLFSRGDDVAAPRPVTFAEIAPLELPAWAAWATSPVRRVNTLPAQLAVTARLNVPVGRVARTSIGRPVAMSKPRPIAVAVSKRTPSARSVHLQARHLAAVKRTRPSNVVALPAAQPLPARQALTAAAA